MSLLLKKFRHRNPSLLSVGGYTIGYHVRYCLLHFFRIKYMTRRKINSDKMHPCLDPVSILKNSELPFSVFIQQLLFKNMF